MTVPIAPIRETVLMVTVDPVGKPAATAAATIRGSGMQSGARLVAGAVLAGALTVSACSSSSKPSTTSASSGAPTTTSSPASSALSTSAPAGLPASRTVWLCRPGLAADPCTSSETATVVGANGATTTETTTPAVDPKVDCFYVYPTVSDQKTPLANLTIDPEERAIAITQASRFAHVCRIFAPMYRQATLAAITGATSGGTTPKAVKVDTGYQDVVAAWKDYLARDNGGRGVVFLGHSQGSGVLIRLLQQQVDKDPSVRRLLVAALILGGNVTVKQDSDVGGDFENIPACRRRAQTGCVVAYSSFSQAPPADSLFGRPGTGPRTGDAGASDLQVLCVNPVDPAAASGRASAYFTTTKFPGLIGTVSGPVPKATTPWVAYPDRYDVACTSAAGATWLQVTPVAGDRRPAVTQTLGPTWGLHLYDFNVALGDLVALVESEVAAYRPS